MWKRFVLMKPEGGGEGGGGGGGAAAPAPAAAAPAAAASPAPAAAAPAPAAAAPAPAAGTPAAAPAAEVKAIWPENWRETVSKDDAKMLQRLSRYGSPEDVAKALIAAQNRIASGELKPVLGKDASPEELKEWRQAHGIPEAPDKYDLGKEVKLDEADKPIYDVLFKAAHDSNQTPEQVKATVQAINRVKEAVAEHQEKQDQRFQQEGEDALRAEWGGEFRRNINLVHGLFDGSGSQDLKDQVLSARLADGRPIGSSAEAMKMLLGLALIKNPAGVVVEGGSGVTGEGIKTELEKLQKIPPAKKTAKQDERQRSLITAAINANLMDANGNWK
jgi:hypothetical protein